MITRILASMVAVAFAASFWASGVAAQSESASAEDGKPASEAPANTSTAPSVPIGANLTPPVGLTPPTSPIIGQSGTGQPGSSSVSMAPGTLTAGTAREGRNAERAPEETAPPQDDAPSDGAPVATCADYPTWYDSQIALESSDDPALNASLDPDGNEIACEEVMYP